MKLHSAGSILLCPGWSEKNLIMQKLQGYYHVVRMKIIHWSFIPFRMLCVCAFWISAVKKHAPSTQPDVILSCALQLTLPLSFPLLQGAIYGMAQSIPDRSIVSEISWGFLDCLYSTEDPRANSNHMNGNGKANWGGRALLLALDQNAHRESRSPPDGSSEPITQHLPYIA